MLHYTFTKEYMGNHEVPGYGRVRAAARYQVYDEHRLLGELFHCKDFTQARYNGKTILLKKQQPWYKKPWHKIITQETGEEMGELRLNGFASVWDRIFINNQVYRWKRVSPDVRYSLFNRSTWNHYKISLFSNEETCNYHFHLESTKHFRAFDKRAITGKIDYSGNNPLVVIAGLYFVESWLYQKERED